MVGQNVSHLHNSGTNCTLFILALILQCQRIMRCNHANQLHLGTKYTNYVASVFEKTQGALWQSSRLRLVPR
jgi:hypothetical protein